MNEQQRKPSGDVQYVLDGGALLHRVPWPWGYPYESVEHLYVRYVTQKYGATVMNIMMIRQPKMPAIGEEREIVNGW